MTWDVSCVGLYIVDILGRPVTRIPEGGRADYIDEIAMTVAGTAGATALDCAVMGLKTRAATLAGSDALGNFLVNELEAVGVDCSLVARTDAAQTSATILPVRPNGERPALHVPGTAALFVLPDEAYEAALDAKVVHLGGTGLLRGFDGAPSERFMSAAKRKGRTTTLDLIQARPETLPLVAPLLPHTDYFIPSMEEAAELTGRADPDEAARALQDLGAANVVLTLGGEGVFARLSDGTTLSRPAHAIAVVDTTGCGDCFSAGLIAGLVRGWDMDRTLAYASAAAALVAMGLGSRGKLASDAAVREAMGSLPLRV